MIRKKVGLGAVALGLVVWAIYPGSHLAIDLDTCKPSGGIETIRSRAFPTQFWAGQQEAIETEITGFWESKKLQAEQERVITTAVQDLEASMEQYYRDNPEARPPKPSRADRLHEMTEEAEQREALAYLEQYKRRRLGKLEQCQNTIAGRG